MEFDTAENATKFLEEYKDKEVKIEENALTFSKPGNDTYLWLYDLDFKKSLI